MRISRPIAKRAVAVLLALHAASVASAQEKESPAEEVKASASSRSSSRSSVRGFGDEAGDASSRGFGEAAGGAKTRADSSAAVDAERERARRNARGLVRKYDADRNGVLERNEWSKIRGDPAKSDANGDGVLTFDEIANRLLERRLAAKSESKTGASRVATKAPVGTKAGNKSKSSNERASYRFTPAKERLPDGLPSWFRQRDANGDGQVAMSEYSRGWSASRVRDFQRYDRNNDGFVTPDEVKKK